MKILIDRFAKKETYTVGKMYVNGTYLCDTLEDRVRDLSKEAKVMHQTAIPAGTYSVVLSHSPRFGRMLPAILNVPHFEGIRIHAGNTHQDTSGCILVGENRTIGKVINSKQWEKRIIELIGEAVQRSEKIEITIR